MLAMASSNVMQSLDNHHKKMVGEILTLIEASVHDSPSSAALKMAIKRTIWRLNQDMKDEMNSMTFTTGDTNG